MQRFGCGLAQKVSGGPPWRRNAQWPCTCAVVWNFLDTKPIRQFGRRHTKKALPHTTYLSIEPVEHLPAQLRQWLGRPLTYLPQRACR
jgi:hypothetical protein